MLCVDVRRCATAPGSRPYPHWEQNLATGPTGLEHLGHAVVLSSWSSFEPQPGQYGSPGARPVVQMGHFEMAFVSPFGADPNFGADSNRALMVKSRE